MKRVLRSVTAVVLLVAASFAQASIVRWEGTATKISLPGSVYAGVVTGFFDFDTMANTFVVINLTYDTAGVANPRAATTTVDTLNSFNGLVGDFVRGADGPDFANDLVITVFNAAGFGVVGDTLDTIGVRACANAQCTGATGLGILPDTNTFVSRLLQPVGTVPEPSTIALLALAPALLFASRRSKARSLHGVRNAAVA